MFRRLTRRPYGVSRWGETGGYERVRFGLRDTGESIEDAFSMKSVYFNQYLERPPLANSSDVLKIMIPNEVMRSIPHRQSESVFKDY